MPWNFSKWDWGELLWVLIPIFFGALMGVLLAFVGGILVIHLLLEVFLG